MGQFLDIVIASSKRSRGLAEKLLVGIKPEQAARKPHFEGGGAPVVVDTNHPTFVYGHLALYPGRMLRLAGADVSAVAVPPEWENLMKAGSPCLDDPEGKIYPSIGAVSSAFFKHMDTAYAALAKMDDSMMLTPTPDERYREFFPTTGMALTFMLNSHVMMHMGQVSAWRRCFGLPSAM